MDKLIFYPPDITERKEWYRFFSSGFIHADVAHLAFNMYALYGFGAGSNNNGLEYHFINIFGSNGKLIYLSMYLLALVVSLIPTYQKNKENQYYKSLGASGAVSAVVFAYIFLNPVGYMGIILIPVYFVSFLFGALYLLISYYLDKQGGGNINHSAHIWGALFGLLFLFVACRVFVNYPVVSLFAEEIKNFDFTNIVRLPN
jgi:membrane associated rhomboid family serine protease